MELMDIRNWIESKLKEKYKYETEDKRTFYYNSKGEIFELVLLGETEPWNCFVISYIDDGEDGDQFYPVDYKDLNIMFEEMIKEIEG